MSAQILTMIDDEAEFAEVAERAAKDRLFIVTNGQRCFYSPFVPKGWAKVKLRVKSPTYAALEVMPCAA